MRDTTQFSFEEKLKKYLDTIFIKDEIIEKIRQSFIGYIFLSYRKKDRKYAQELMKLIHSYEFCCDIAIWYDEFLIPGENFDEAIQKAMTNSNLMTISVTPSLLEESNYIMEHEFPDAKALKLPIIPVILSPTDREALKKNSVEAQINLDISYDNLGDIREKQDDLDNAKEYYKKSLFINERLADKLKTPIDDYNVMCCYLKIGLLCTGKERAEWLNKAEKILQQLYELYYDEPLYAEMFEGILEMVENDISKTEL